MRMALRPLRPYLVALASALAVVAPWVVFRAHFDTTASVELKWHLAGVKIPNHRSLLQTMRDQYANLGVEGWFRHRYANLDTLLRVPYLFGLNSGKPTGGLQWRIVHLEQLQPLWSGGILILAAPLLFVRRRLTREVYVVAAAGGISVLLWTVAEYGPPLATTGTNNAPYAPLVLINIALAATLALVLAPRLLAVVVAAQGAIWLWTSYSIGVRRACYGNLCTETNYATVGVSGSHTWLSVAVLAVLAAIACGLAVLASTAPPVRHDAAASEPART